MKASSNIYTFNLAFLMTVLSFSTQAQDSLLNGVIQQLFAIDELDQRYRNQIDFVESQYGKDSPEIRELYKKMKQADSVNLIAVEAILAKYGWLGYKEIGSQANTTLFMVIQHSSYQTQKKYFPMLREAVKNGKAKASNLALLEDRIGIKETGIQTYGSQLFWSQSKNRYVVAPIINPEEADERRKLVGLEPLSDYLSVYGLSWDVEQYKTELPVIISEMKQILH